MYKSIQAGRALAALSVAAYHLSITMGDSRYGGEEVFRDFTSRGYLGVDFFFVLSGFIILFAHFKDVDHSGRLFSYLLKRGIRLYPIYLLYTIPFCLLVFFGLGAGSTLPSTWLGWVSSFTLFHLNSEPPPLLVAWTLFLEVLFYGFFSILILNKRVGLAAFLLWVMGIIFYFEYGPSKGSSPLQVFFSAYNLNFLVGMAAFFVFKHASEGQARIVLILGMVSLFFLAAVGSGGYVEWQSLHVALAVSFGMLLSGFTALESRLRGFNLPLLTLVGDSSYSIYLLHTSIQGLLLKVSVKSNFYESLGREGVYVIVFLFSTAIACIAYVLIEKPLLEKLRLILFSPRSAVA